MSFMKKLFSSGKEEKGQQSNPSSPPPAYTEEKEPAKRWTSKVENVSVEKSQDLTYHMVFAIDISGSMVNYKDAYDRANLKVANLSRFEAVKRDALLYMSQLTASDRLVQCDVILFGLAVYEHRNIRTVKELEDILSQVKTFERATRTDLALAKANEWFLEHMVKYGTDANRPTFFNLVMTDGSPTCPGKTDEDIKTAVAELLVAGTDPMLRDEDRVTLFLQYGTSDYSEHSSVSKFLKFLDDDLQEISAEWFKEKYPNKEWSDDDLKNLFDACDTGKQCTTWTQKDPENKMKNVDRTACWDSNIEQMFDIATSD